MRRCHVYGLSTRNFFKYLLFELVILHIQSPPALNFSRWGEKWIDHSKKCMFNLKKNSRGKRSRWRSSQYYPEWNLYICSQYSEDLAYQYTLKRSLICGKTLPPFTSFSIKTMFSMLKKLIHFWLLLRRSALCGVYNTSRVYLSILVFKGKK